MTMQAMTLQSLQPSDRVQRRPKHKFHLNVKPYAITPFMLAPVLPGETYQSSWMEAREVSDPIANSLIGWASEWMVFYVKIRDLNERNDLDDLFINPTASVAGLNTAANTKYYHRGSSPNFTEMALRRVVETYFRDDGEAWNNFTIDGYPAAQYKDFGWMDSLTDTNVLSAGAGDPGAASTPEALDRIMDAYEYLRSMQLMDMEFEDYLRTFGVKITKEEMNKPTLIHSWREFQYPSNTVEPTTGIPTSALSWVHKSSHKADKGFFFREPGFLLGVHVLRPKLYYGRQYGSMAHHLDQGLSWLPAIMRDSPETSLREFTGGAAGNGPLSDGVTGPTNGYWVDMRDLFLYGDQFHNRGATPPSNMIGLPDTALNHKYPSEAMVDTLFTGAAASRFVRSDGFATLTIKSHTRDTTPTVSVDAL